MTKYPGNTLILKSMKRIDLDTHIFLLADFFSAAECERYIAWSEDQGYEEARVQIDGKQTMFKSIRNNSRLMFHDNELAATLWEKFKPFAFPEFGNNEVSGLNEMFRFYKYEPGQRFKKHIDGSYIRNEEEASYFTLMIYLNDDFEGGETLIEKHSIKPQKGMALAFYHGIRHSGEPIIEGTKYVLRTDVMYKLKK